jgi:hypothetical protein
MTTKQRSPNYELGDRYQNYYNQDYSLMQLSLIPDLVPSQPTAKKQANSRQLSLNILGSVATVPVSTKPKQALTTSQAWYNGKICTIIKRSKEEFDGLTIKICTIKTQSGQILEVPENHITVL